MRKIFIALITVLLFTSTTWAAMTPGTVNDELVCSGSALAGEKVTFVLLDADALGTYDDDDEKTLKQTVNKYYSNIDDGIKMTAGEIFYFYTVGASENGTWSYTVPMNEISKKNLVMISNSGDAEYICYASIDYRKDIIPALKQKAAQNDECEGLENVISENIKFISENYKAYADILDKRKVAQMASEEIKAVDEKAETALSDVKSIVDKAILIEQVVEKKLEDFDEIVKSTSISSDLLATISAQGKLAVVSDVCGKEYESFADYDKKLTFSVCFHGFYNSTNKNGDRLAEYLIKNNAILELDISKFEVLSQTNRARAASELLALNASDKTVMQANIDNIIKKINETSSGGSGGSSGSSGSSGSGTSSGSAYTASIPASISDKNIQEQKNIYSDMADVQWAADAIVYLTDNKIINGYENNLFKPMQSVTRAEFTKMVVCAFLGNVTDDVEGLFKDVSENDWYTPYIEAAYKAHIVNGDENGFFRPDESISRQDMAVIIYNAGIKFNLFENISSKQTFKDDSSISDYARDAVYCLKSYSIINGTGDGLFSPLEYADRASAAQIIYSLMLKDNK